MEKRCCGSEQSSASLKKATTTLAPSRRNPDDPSPSARRIASSPWGCRAPSEPAWTSLATHPLNVAGSVELRGEAGQRLGEPTLLAGHRKGVVDDEEDVGLRRHLHLAVLRHGDQCRRLHRDRDVALAGHSRDDQREKGYNCPD